MIRKPLVLLLVFLFALSCSGLPAGPSVNIAGNYYLWHQAWQSTNNEFQPGVVSATARIIHFGSNGDFEMLACVLIKNPKRIIISVGDYPSAWLGKYAQHGHTVEITYRIAMMVDQPVTEPSPNKTETITIANDNAFTFGRCRFSPNQAKELEKQMEPWISEARKLEKKKA